MELASIMPVMRSGVQRWRFAMLGALLIGIVFYFLHFSYAYLDFPKQMVLGWSCFILLLLMYRGKRFQQQPWRLIFIAVSAFLALRYIQWRTFDTLQYTGPMDFLGMSLLYLAEIYGLVLYFLGMFVNVWPLESKILPLPAETEKLPSVDIYIATYNEPDDILRITATAATQLDYPKEKLNIYIIDDGGTWAKRNDAEHGMEAWERHYRIREMAADLGIGYLTRETNQQAKAGNINHALQNTDGDLVLILDCDHVPTRDLLQNTVGHFVADPKLFLVQTPHFFINPTPVEKNLEGMANPSAENDLFYRSMHPAMNFWNASYFCGSAALLRRQYLLEVGGICGTTITEDAETAFQLHSRGYNSVYINRPMVCGLSPESYDDYVIQRSRWAQGMVQLVMLNNPLRKAGLSLPQRIVYFNSSFFWFFGFPRFIYFIAPALYLIFGLSIYNASWMQIVSFTLPYVLSLYLTMDYFYRGTRQPFFSEIYESVQSLFLIPALISVMLNPWKPSFKVTPKGQTNDRNYLSPLAAPFFLVIGINLIAVALGVVKWFTEPIIRDVIIVTIIWSFYNLYLSVVSLGAFWERKQIRKYYRIGASGKMNVHFQRMGSSHAAEVKDVSLTGLSFEADLPFLPREHDQVVLEIKDRYSKEYRISCLLQRITMRNGRYACGTAFIADSANYADVVSYVFGDSLRWQENWERKSQASGTYRMLWYFMRTGVRGFFGSVIPLLLSALRIVWQWTRVLTTTHFVRNKFMAFTSWLVYFFYQGLVSLFEALNKKQVRIFERIRYQSDVTVYFPRLDATLIGEVGDVSLTGIGFITELPFQLKGRERVMVKVKSHDGTPYQFPSMVERVIERDGKMLCGVNFIVDTHTYPTIVRFVYGDSWQMVRYVLKSGGSLVVQGKRAVVGLLARMFKRIGAVLSYMFLNPEKQAREK